MAGLRLLALGVGVALIWCAHYDRWRVDAWHVPTEYSGDAPEVLAEIKAASEGVFWPFTPKVVERLGAPFGAHWNAYPVPDKPYLMLLGALVRPIGLFATANLGLLAAAILASWSFYLVARWLRVRGEWAAAGALLFAFTYQTFHRGLGHFSLTLSWTVPLGLLAVWLVARSQRLAWRSREIWICLGAAVALGAGNPYYLLFWLQLMGWAVIAQWCDRRRRENLQVGFAALGLAIAVFFASNLEVWLHVQEPQAPPLLERNYGGTEMYALKPIELLIPPAAHRWEAFAFLGQRYARWSLLRGEGFPPYLGVVGILGLLALSVVAVRRLLTRRAPPGQALSIGWLAAYATMGGVTNLLALLVGLQVFRATNRVGVYLAAIVLFYVVVRLARFTSRWPVAASRAAAILVATVGLFDQLPRPVTAAQRAELAAQVTSDRELGRALESALPPGSKIFQLPVLGFPEERPPHRLADYELFRPYLMTDTLHFSYGATKFRSRIRWQRELETLAPKVLARRLEAYGFSGLYVNRRGFEDQADALLRELRAGGYERQIVSPRGQQVVVLLEPSPQPKLPLARGFSFGRTWHPRAENGVRWAHDDAVLSYFNPYDYALSVDVALQLVAVTDGDLNLTHQGRVLRRVRVGPEPVTVELAQVEMAPGINFVNLSTDIRARRVSSGQYQLRSFGLGDARIRVTAPITMLD